MAAQLSKDDALVVETVRGGLGEFSVYIDGKKVVDTNRLWYPTTSTVVAKTRTFLAKQSR